MPRKGRRSVLGIEQVLDRGRGGDGHSPLIRRAFLRDVRMRIDDAGHEVLTGRVEDRRARRHRDRGAHLGALPSPYEDGILRDDAARHGENVHVPDDDHRRISGGGTASATQ